MFSRSCHVSQLPDDLQVLVCDLVEDGLGEVGLQKLETYTFLIRILPTAAFPEVEMWTDYRGRAYSKAMIGAELPPVILCRSQWLDGRNRVWAARRSGKAMVDCIDLGEIGLSTSLGRLGTLRIEEERDSDRRLDSVLRRAATEKSQ